jgi:acetyl-CoA carboxylase alpha subunit
MTDQINKLGDIQNQQDVLKSRTELADLMDKSKIINEKMVEQMDKSTQLALKRENERIATFEKLKEVTLAGQEIANGIDKIFVMLAKTLPAINTWMGEAREFMGILKKSRIVRGIGGWFK